MVDLPAVTATQGAIWTIVAVATAGVILRPRGTPEALWAVGGAALLVLAGLVPYADAWRAVGRSADVCMFLAGMMLLAETARVAGIFDLLAVLAVRHAGGSATRLFTAVYVIGTLVTVTMSNDATAVVLTPAVCAVVRRAGARPLPHLIACAMIANAASFVLPISNPANLVVFGTALPPLGDWLRRFGWPSAAAILATYAVLRLLHRRDLAEPIAPTIESMPPAPTAPIAAAGIAVVASVLLAVSAFGGQLGLPTLLGALLVALAVAWHRHVALWGALRRVSWSVLALVAGLFVLVEGLVRSGAVEALGRTLARVAAAAPDAAPWLAGTAVAIAANLVNNLPAGLVAGSAVRIADVAEPVRSAVAIGIDLGPNLTVAGSLATILWLIALRREGIRVTGWQFFRVGLVAMPVALLLALAALGVTLPLP